MTNEKWIIFGSGINGIHSGNADFAQSATARQNRLRPRLLDTTLNGKHNDRDHPTKRAGHHPQPSSILNADAPPASDGRSRHRRLWPRSLVLATKILLANRLPPAHRD